MHLVLSYTTSNIFLCLPQDADYNGVFLDTGRRNPILKTFSVIIYENPRIAFEKKCVHRVDGMTGNGFSFALIYYTGVKIGNLDYTILLAKSTLLFIGRLTDQKPSDSNDLELCL